MKEELIRRLKTMMNQREITAAELSRRSGIRASSISDYLNGKYEPKQDNIDKMAHALNVTPAWLMGYNTSSDSSSLPSGTFKPIFKQVPLLGYVAAGKPLEDLNQDVSYVDIDGKYNVDFCVKVVGDSMIDIDIHDGDIIFARSMPSVENGQIAVVEIDHEKACLKRFYRSNNTITLVSANPKYPPMVFDENNCESVEVKGLAVIKQSEIK
jgi:repressor LexA|nr:MAG TPA: Repressor protein CI [Caudoviricetes sp.]